MDDTDKAILRLLQSDAKTSIEKIAVAVGLSHTPVWRRIDRLEKAKVILGATCKLDRLKLGLELTAFASIKLSRHDEKALVEFERAVRDIPEILDCYSMTGSFDYLLKIVTYSVSSYEQLLKKKLANLPHFQDVHSNLALREVKQTDGIPI